MTDAQKIALHRNLEAVEWNVDMAALDDIISPYEGSIREALTALYALAEVVCPEAEYSRLLKERPTV